MTEPIVYVYTSKEVPQDMTMLKSSIKKFTNGVLADFKMTNSHMGGKVAKLIGSTVATSCFYSVKLSACRSYVTSCCF